MALRNGDYVPAEQRSTGTLLADVVNQVSELFRKELQLFRAELGEKMDQAVSAVGRIVVGVVLMVVALNALMAALIAAIATFGIDGGWAALIAGVVVLVIGYAMVSSGRDSLRASSLAPERTAHSLRRDAEVARETVR